VALLEERGLKPTVIEYLKTPPNATELKEILAKLGLKPIELVRKGEGTYKEKFGDRPLSDAQLIAAMIEHPELIERPIVVKGERAVLGRPPENVLTLLK